MTFLHLLPFRFGQLPIRTYWVLTGFLILATVLVLLFMGREPVCTCGVIKIWHGEVWSSENSQHLFDFYTFSHIAHGFGFYWLMWVMARNKSLGLRGLLALLLEIGWEILENSPIIIDRYRESTVSLHYYGDSVVNSVADIIAMVVGFWLAARLPLWMTLLITITMEIVVVILIRDNLTLNIIMLLYPSSVIKAWQAGG